LLPNYEYVILFLAVLSIAQQPIFNKFWSFCPSFISFACLICWKWPSVFSGTLTLSPNRIFSDHRQPYRFYASITCAIVFSSKLLSPPLFTFFRLTLSSVAPLCRFPLLSSLSSHAWKCCTFLFIPVFSQIVPSGCQFYVRGTLATSSSRRIAPAPL